jgi:CyaY protein
MTDTEFLDRAEALLRRIELACDRINDEIRRRHRQPAGWRHGHAGLSPTGTQIIVNLQKPLHEVWLAAQRRRIPLPV